jgi:hypothetical protein
VQSVLTMPGKQPSYRRNRTHTAFLTNVHVPRRELKEALRSVWDAADELREFPLEETQRLAKTRYSSDEWTLRL